ncbi:hypothetical protein Baya_5131 [Bagarius yarrelli]|uniref:Uncharacterized protein n=1 Tax=Bagarius yarrelli TaxID=175774 RepID=A0A556TTM7_BAGYA|nr:hypothetical protein Baya_5131 [Bagarius yarrelli]
MKRNSELISKDSPKASIILQLQEGKALERWKDGNLQRSLNFSEFYLVATAAKKRQYELLSTTSVGQNTMVKPAVRRENL